MWLLRTLTIIFWAVIDGLVCWGILLPNLRNLREEPSDHYLSTSITCLVFMNVAGVWGADMSSEVFESNDRKRIMDAAAHNFLITMTLIMLLAMDAYFVAVIHMWVSPQHSSLRCFTEIAGMYDSELIATMYWH